MKLNFRDMTRAEKSWVMYDWANSVYAIIVMTSIYPIFFSQVAGEGGDALWAAGSSAAMLAVAIAAPIVGAFADYRGYKRKLFLFFFALGIGFTIFAAFAQSVPAMLTGYVVSNIGFSTSCLMYDSFLTDTTTPERMDTVSGYGYAMGYIGGSTIPFVAAIILVQTVGGALAVRISMLITAAWWLVFSIPFIKNIRQEHWIEKPRTGAVGSAFRSVLETAKKIYRDKTVFKFVVAYFFYIDGVGTIIKMSTSYGAALGLDATGMTAALLVTQLVAVPCSIWFSRLARRFGSMKILTGAVCVYLAICCVGFIMGFGLEESWFGNDTGLVLFWTLAFMVGTVQGGIQALSRSHFGRLVPPENSGEYFGFFDIFGKFATVMGPALYAVTKTITGRSSFSILSIVLLFAVALIIMSTGKKEKAA